MTTLLATLCGATAALGIYLLVIGLRKRVPDPRPTATTGISLSQRWARVTRRAKLTLLAGVVAGVVGFALTGWVLLIVLVPVALLLVPWLLSAPPNRELDLLVALDRWVRTLASSIPTGKSIGDAVRATRTQTPPLLADPVTRACVRMDARWSTSDALLAMADELASADADACLAALSLASRRGGTGAAATLAALSTSMNDRLRAMREIETERAKPRAVVRQVTLITMVVIAAALLLGGNFFAPYRTPFGQALLALLLSLYLGSLVMLRRRTQTRPRDRILTAGGGR